MLRSFLRWILGRPREMTIELSRVNFEESRLRRVETFSCDPEYRAKIARRMTVGDAEWIPPLREVARAHKAWRRRHRRHKRGNVVPMPEKEAK